MHVYFLKEKRETYKVLKTLKLCFQIFFHLKLNNLTVNVLDQH